MALELTSAITATDPEFRVTGTVPDTIEPGFRFRLDDELLSLQGFGEDESIRGSYARQWAPRDRQRWIVNRGIDSVPASHDAGTELLAANDAFGSSEDLTPPGPFTAGGGGLPTGWTQDGDPANVDTQGGNITAKNIDAIGLGGAPGRLTLWDREGSTPVIIPTTGDPSLGFAADRGSLVLRTNGQLWLKTGAGNTDWEQVGGVPAGAIQTVRVPIAYNTPGLTTTGIEVYTPTVGDILLMTVSMVRVTTAWDGTTPTLTMDSEGGSWGSIFSSGDLSSGDFAGPNWTNIGLVQSGAIYLSTTVPLVAKVDDGGGGDPGSTQGEGEIVLVIAPA